MMPALLMRTSNTSVFLPISSRAVCTDFGSVTSSCIASMCLNPSVFNRFMASRPLSKLRLPRNTKNPFSNSVQAVSNPIPLFAPVINTVFLFLYCLDFYCKIGVLKRSAVYQMVKNKLSDIFPYSAERLLCYSQIGGYI